MRVIWLHTALDGLKIIHRHIAADNPQSAYNTLKNIKKTTEEMLAAYPSAGRPGRVAGTRELVIKGTSYIVPYRIHKDRVEILHVLHGAQDWPDKF